MNIFSQAFKKTFGSIIFLSTGLYTTVTLPIVLIKVFLFLYQDTADDAGSFKAVTLTGLYDTAVCTQSFPSRGWGESEEFVWHSNQLLAFKCTCFGW